MQLKTKISFLLVIIAIIYLGSLIIHQPFNNERLLGQLAISTFLLSLLPAVAMVFFAAAYHVLTVGRLSPNATSRIRVMKAYSVSQVVRYLPGKIWGIVYEANSLSREVSAKHVITANLMQALLTNLMAVGFSAIIIAFWLFQQVWILLLAPAVVIAIEFLHRKPLLERKAIALISRFLSRSNEELVFPPPLEFWATAMLILEWAAFVVVWWLLLNHELMINDILILSAYYAFASILSVAALAVPGGIAIREALFIGLASSIGIDQVALLGYAAAARIVFTAAEFFLVFLIYPLSMVYKWRQV